MTLDPWERRKSTRNSKYKYDYCYNINHNQTGILVSCKYDNISHQTEGRDAVS